MVPHGHVQPGRKKGGGGTTECVLVYGAEQVRKQVSMGGAARSPVGRPTMAPEATGVGTGRGGGQDGQQALVLPPPPTSPFQRPPLPPPSMAPSASWRSLISTGVPQQVHTIGRAWNLVTGRGAVLQVQVQDPLPALWHGHTPQVLALDLGLLEAPLW